MENKSKQRKMKDTYRHEEECSLLILVDAMHFLKHCPLVSVADKRYIYLFPF